MNILIDTNIIIPLEDTNKLLKSSFANMKKLASELRYCLYIHPMQYEDIKRDKNIDRKKTMFSRLNQYPLIENPPILTDEDLMTLGLTQVNDNDKVDNNLVFTLYRGAVNLLVTEDVGIHKKAAKLNLQDKVYRHDQFINFLEQLSHKTISNKYSGVYERYLYEIDNNKPFFDSLRETYPEFDIWFKKKSEQRRKCWCIEDENSQIVAICIYKDEENKDIGKLSYNGEVLNGKVLKLCTFKVAPSARGKKLGERMLYIAFKYCKDNNYDWVYLHTDGKEQKSLVGLCEEYGFRNQGKCNLDDVYIKPMKICDKLSDEIDSFVTYYPYFRNNASIHKFIIPIKPQYHEILFPDFSKLQGSLFENEQQFCQVQGNTIKKAYLCHSSIKKIKRGDIVLFYRSGDDKSIKCMGIVETSFVSEDINEVLPAIAKRTVYSCHEVKNMLKKRTLVILFRYIGLNVIGNFVPSKIGKIKST